MYRYIKAYELGYTEGIKDSLYDLKNNKMKKFKNINKNEIMSKLYDIGYIDGYTRFYKNIKKESFNSYKNIV